MTSLAAHDLQRLNAALSAMSVGQIRNWILTHTDKRVNRVIDDLPGNPARMDLINGVLELAARVGALEMFSELLGDAPAPVTATQAAQPAPGVGWREQVRYLVANNRLREALLLLQQQPEQQEAASLLLGRLTRTESDERLGMVTREVAQTERTRLALSALELSKAGAQV